MLDAARDVIRPAANATALDGGAARVELRGELPLGWCGNLAAGLSRRNVSITRGSADREGTSWNAVFEVVSESGPLPTDLDYAAIALEETADQSSAIRLESFVLTTPRRGGPIELTVRGPDRTGFLAALLDRLAQLGLFPGRISVETVHGMAADTLWLHAVGGLAPTERSVESLREFLRGVTGMRTS